LEARNHNVVLAFTGIDGLKAYTDSFAALSTKTKNHDLSEHSYDVVIIDYKMLDIDGAKVANAILDLDPKQRILFATAYSSDLLSHFADIASGGRIVEILDKPFDGDMLVRRVEDVDLHRILRTLGVAVDSLLKAGATHDQLSTMLDKLKKLELEN